MNLTEEEIEKRVSSPDNLINRLTVHRIERAGRGMEIPMEIRKVVAIVGQEETCRDVAKVFDIGKSTANNLSNGEVSNKVVPELKHIIDSTRSEINKVRTSAESEAVDLLLSSLGVLKTEEGILGTKKGKLVASTAKDLAAITNMMGNGKDIDGKGERAVHVHLYAPKQKKVEDYEVIDV